MFRTNPITGEPVLFAPERASRRGAFGDESPERCPFCPGHESDTPPELARIGEPWRVRVFPNKYPPIDGAEVIVESPRHEESFATAAHAEDIVRMYADRCRAHADAAFVSLFKNEGTRAGASIAHAHSQVVPLPFLPPRIERELAGFGRGCALCDLREHVIRETELFLWLSPSASAFPYQQWIVPKRHVHELGAMKDDELRELASLLRDAARTTRAIAPAFNWMFMSFPRAETAHFYVDLVPRMAAIAGFELHTGTFVEIIDPADAARRLRETE
ncbi:MAG: galactose-1-phosphate uridylyltransferase [Thermoanaerobaculia bacterium]